jgi:DNA-binding response OmpR family regulator
MEKIIYIIDDEESILEALKFMLEYDGYIVKISTTGNVLFEMTDQLPDLILLDFRLANEDGREIARKLKANEKTKHIPIILISAHLELLKNLKEYGIDDFMAKPFEIDEMLNKINKYTHKRWNLFHPL